MINGYLFLEVTYPLKRIFNWQMAFFISHQTMSHQQLLPAAEGMWAGGDMANVR